MNVNSVDLGGMATLDDSGNMIWGSGVAAVGIMRSTRDGSDGGG